MNNRIIIACLFFNVSVLVHSGAQETPAQSAATEPAIGSVAGKSREPGSDSANPNSTADAISSAAASKEQPVTDETSRDEAETSETTLEVVENNSNATEAGERVTFDEAPSSTPGNSTPNREEPVTRSPGQSNSDQMRPSGEKSKNSTSGKETTTEGYEEMIEEVTSPSCFNSTEIWQADLLRRVIVVEDNVRYQFATLMGPVTASRKTLLRRALYHLMLLEKIVSQVSAESEDESGASDTLFRSERNFNRIGWIVYRGRNGWHFYDCCYQSLEQEDPIETMCGQRGEIDSLNRMHRL